MCTVTLSYDKDNAQARQMLATMFHTGMFFLVDVDEAEDEALGELPVPSDRNLSLDELEALVVNDIRTICSSKDAVPV